MFEFSLVLTLLLIFESQSVNSSNTSNGSGTRFSVRIEEVVNGSHVEIDVQQTAEDRDKTIPDCPPGQYLTDHQLASKSMSRRGRYGRHGFKQSKGSRHTRIKRGFQCRHCSACSEGQVVLSPCTANQDTQCGICIDVGKNRTCVSTRDVNVFQDIPISNTDETSLNPPTSSEGLSNRPILDNPGKIPLTKSNDLLAESEGDSSDFIGALATAALSLVMLLILMVTAPLVIYLKVRDWCRYGRPPQQEAENGHCWNSYACCNKQCYASVNEQTTTPCSFSDGTHPDDNDTQRDNEPLRMTNNPAQDSNVLNNELNTRHLLPCKNQHDDCQVDSSGGEGLRHTT